MNLPTRSKAQNLLEKHVRDPYQRYHALMVATVMEGYADLYNEDKDLWYLVGLLHDLDFGEYPDTHPAESLKWFKEWNYPEEMIHAVEAHAYSYNGFTTLPQTTLAKVILASDEMCGIFYAYQKMNSVPFGEMRASSIKKKFNDETFAAKIDRSMITRGCDMLGISIDDHIDNLIKFLKDLGIRSV